MVDNKLNNYFSYLSASGTSHFLNLKHIFVYTMKKSLSAKKSEYPQIEFKFPHLIKMRLQHSMSFPRGS